MKTKRGEFPLEIKISFRKLFDLYRNQLDSGRAINRAHAESVLALEEQFPKLSEGLETEQELQDYKEQIDLVLDDLFPVVATKNEIKVATTPFQELIFKSSQRYKDIVAAAGPEFEMELINFNENYFYIMGCSIILGQYYGYTIDFKRPFYYNIPDGNGSVRNYRVLYNGDFIEIEKTDKAKEITQADVDELLENFDDIEVWKEKFPVGGWIFKGFVIANMFDVTLDTSISDFKSHLLRSQKDAEVDTEDEFRRIFRNIFNLPDVEIGFSDYNEEENRFEKILYKNLKSFILGDKSYQDCREALCDTSYYVLFKNHDLYVVTNTEKYHQLYPDNVLYKKLLQQGFKSAIFASIVHQGNMLGVLELASPHENALNTINARKLEDVMPFLVDSVVRAKEQMDNELELIIQEECTSIHSSVHWKFRNEAKRFMATRAAGNPSYFREVVFRDVYPLYGQIDVIGSSEARNEATKKDLVMHLETVQHIIRRLYKQEPLPIYEHLDFRIVSYLDELREELQVNSERQVLRFLQSEIVPLLKHIEQKNSNLEQLITEYNDLVDAESGLVYKHRRDFDDTVMAINKKLAAVIDKKQVEAQKMYPHYFERYKTDGVEHSLFIGESITQHAQFNKIYLYNLRLWQLQVMCEMENSYYKMKEELPIQLEVATMVLSFNSPLALRFRMDEKRFDVDGTYNARYEVVKKRVDKALIKGTEERVTKAGKITIIYSQKDDEKEYLKYIAFLQHKKQLDTDEEIVTLEDLQGVTGLKAIRVSVLYTKGTSNAKEYYTYDDLIDELKA
jgi:hypothetical protein